MRSTARGRDRPAARLALLDADGIAHALLYPSLGLQWEAEVDDPAYALANTRAYNRWIEGFCADSGGRLVPIAHLTLGDADAAATELRRAVRAGAARRLPAAVHARRPAARPLGARSALRGGVRLDVPIALHTGIDPTARSLHHRFDELTWPEAVPFPGALVLQVMFTQAVQQAFTTFFQYATFDRFPRLRLVVLEAGAGGSDTGWIGWTRSTARACGRRSRSATRRRLRPPAVLDLRRSRRGRVAPGHGLRRRGPIRVGHRLPAQRPRRGLHGRAARARRTPRAADRAKLLGENVANVYGL
jgi:predicted TIM-barrel fold metal-dependent hydrolase